MNIDRSTSVKIDVLRFPLVVGVVFIHMGTKYCESIVNSTDSSLSILAFVIHLISIVILSCVVPLFFVISAFLFFAGYRPVREYYFGKLRSRIDTLLIPYIFWNLSYLLFKLIVQTTPILAATIGGTSKRISDYQFFDYFDALSGWTDYPISYQFWFIRDLMIMICLAPVFWWAIKRFSWLPVICFMIIWIVDPGRFANIHNESWFFFSLGCLVAQGKLDSKVSPGNQYGLLFVYAILASITAGLYVAGFHLLSVFSKLVTLGGVATVWYASDLIFKEEKVKNFNIRMSAFSFFIFAAHEPLLGIEMKAISKLSLEQWHTASFVLYFVVPIFTIALLWILGNFLKLRTPWFYKTITGGR